MGRKRDLVSRVASRLARPVEVITKGGREKYQNSPRLAILMFHHITKTVSTNDDRDLTVSTENFRKCCELFKEHFRIVTFKEAKKILDEQRARIINRDEKEKKPLMVFSFDDGYTDFYENAVPIMREFGIKSNQNIVVRFADENREGYMNWEQIRELHKSGLVELGCHTYDKHYFKNGKAVIETLRKDEILEDLIRAKESFERELDYVPEVVAWPYGVAPINISVKELNGLGLVYALNTESGINYSPVDFASLKRFAVLDYEGPEKTLDIIRGYDDLGFLLKKY